MKLIVAGGLCNRLKAIASALRVCKITNQELLVKWIPYIDWIPSRNMLVKIDFPLHWSAISDYPIKFIDDDITCDRVDYHIYEGQEVMRTWRWIRFPNEEDIDFKGNWLNPLIKEMQVYCRELIKGIFDSEYDVGVHYRRFHYEIQHSVLKALIPLEREGKKFFTTDDGFTQIFVECLFPLVKTNKKTFNIKGDYISGVTLNDLRSLASCNEIFASRKSTFADFAWVASNGSITYLD